MSTKDLARKLTPCVIIIVALIVTYVWIYYPPNGKLTCKMSSAPSDITADFTYTIEFKLWNVEKMKAEEVVKAEDEKLLQTFEEELEEEIGKRKELKYYSNEIARENKVLTTTTTLDYTKMENTKLKIGYIKS